MKREDFIPEKQDFGARGSLIPWWVLVVLAFALGIGLPMLLTGCAPAPILTEIDGRRIVELPGHSCPDKSVRETGGCYVPTSAVITYPIGDWKARHHEIEHLQGLVHGQWIDGCALILKGGNTVWIPGWQLCRRNDGSYYQRKQ